MRLIMSIGIEEDWDDVVIAMRVVTDKRRKTELHPVSEFVTDFGDHKRDLGGW
jgi:hypothetical protein